MKLNRNKIFAAGASLPRSRELRSDPVIAGYAASPTLMGRRIGHDLDEVGLQTVQMFHRDAVAAGYEL